jgi:hypothetical protein
LNPLNRLQPASDVEIAVIEANRFITPDLNGYHVVRIRSTDTITSAFVYDSPDDVSYGLNGSTASGTGGFLTEVFLADTAGLIEEGPEFEVAGEDIDKVSDLSSSTEEWRSGTQLCLINNELFFLRSVTATATEGIYRLDGLLRARYGTTQAAHAIDDIVFIFNQADLLLFNQPWVATGRDLYVKTVPVSPTGSVNIEDEVAESIIPYQGGGFRPLQPANLTTEDWTSAWIAGTDIDLRWDYKNASSKAGAGIPLSDEPSQLSLPEGYFKLEILNGSTVVRTVTEISLGSYTYTNANLVSDFGGEPSSFTARVVEVFNGLTSPTEEATITRV